MLPKVFEQYTGGQTSCVSELLLLSEEEFSVKVINYFRSCADDSVFHNCREQYHLIRRSFDHFEQYLNYEYFFDVYIEILFSLFELCHVTASGVVCNLVKIYTLRKVKLFLAKIIKEKLFEKESPLLDITMDLPFGEGFLVQALHHPFLMQIVEVMQRNLRYGARFKTDADTLRPCLMSLYRYLTRIIMPSDFHELVVESDFKRITAVYPTFQEQRRLHFVLVAVYVTKRKRRIKTFLIIQKRIVSLKMVFKAIQEPFITVSEITRFLNLSLSGETKERDIKQFCEDFVEDFPRGAQSSAPRSLKHLCRCTIRQSLTISSQLPHGVFMLNIPRRLKDYILLQRYESEFYPRYVAALSTIKRPLSDVPSSERQKTDLS